MGKYHNYKAIPGDNEKAPLRACIQKGIQQLENGEFTNLNSKKEMDEHFKTLRDRAFNSFNAKGN